MPNERATGRRLLGWLAVAMIVALATWARVDSVAAFTPCEVSSECQSGVCGRNGICCRPECSENDACDEGTGACAGVPTPSPTPTPSPAGSDDDGCNVSARGAAMPELLVPLAVLAIVRVRGRRRARRDPLAERISARGEAVRRRRGDR